MAAFGSFGTTSTTAAGAGPNPNNDVELVQPPTDGISSVKFSPVANHLIATSWDNQVRCWEISPQGQSQPKAATGHDQPVLCADWSPDGSTVFSGKSDWQTAPCYQQAVQWRSSISTATCMDGLALKPIDSLIA